MYTVVNKAAGVATMTFQLADENDRQILIHWLKQIKPATPEGQFEIDKCILAAGGGIDPPDVNYEMMQQ